MEIRILDENNESLSNLINECFNINISPINVLDSKSRNVRFLCALENDIVIGNIMITTLFDPVKNVKSYYLNYVSVLKKYRKKGIATTLLKYVEYLAIKENISYIELTSNSKRIDATRLYLKLGYKIRETNIFLKRMVDDNS